MLLTDPDNQEYITSVKSISGGGERIPPLILCGILILEKWAEEDVDRQGLVRDLVRGESTNVV